MKATGIAVLILGLMLAIVPQFTDCKAVGRAPLQLANGNTTEMKCYWTAQAELAIGLPLALVGALMTFSRRKETWRNLAIGAGALGLAGLAVPTVLIGVCASSMMICNSLMRPLLILGGTLTVVTGALAVVMSWRKQDAALAA